MFFARQHFTRITKCPVSGQTEDKMYEVLSMIKTIRIKPKAGVGINPVFLTVTLHGKIFNGDF